MRKHLAVTLMALAMVGALSGCVFTPKSDPPPPPPPLSPNDTPHNAMLRFVGAYEQKKAQEYQDLFTTDFTYEFSNTTDPDLVAKYSTGWYKADETESSTHLFQGYTPPGLPYAPAASSINIDLANDQPVDDNGVGQDPVTHKFNFTRVDGQIVIPTAPDPTNYLIENNTNVFYLVRGDQAQLNTNQPADSTHWYIYRWLDLTTATAAVAGGLRTASANQAPPITRVTWARAKDATR